jgi:3-oxoacyl-[acyl-carrier protein] reductase
MSRYFERVVDLRGKTALVTGASRGIGAGIAKVLAADGVRVVVNCASGSHACASVVADIKGKGGQAIAVQSDVLNASDVERLFTETKRAFGHLDILVHCSGIHSFPADGNAKNEDLPRYFNNNVLGLLLSTQAAKNVFGPDGGSVFNVQGVAGPASHVGTATDTAVDAVTRSLTKNLESKNIRIHSIKIDVQIGDGGAAPVVQDQTVGQLEDNLVESISQSLRFWALRLESGTITIRHRR